MEKYFLLFIFSFSLFSCINKMIQEDWHDKYEISNKEQLSNIKVLPKLVDALNDKSENVKLSAIHEIRKFGSNAKEAGPVLTKLIENDESEEVKIRATLAIGEIQYDDERTINLLSRNLLLHRNPYVRNASAIALGEIGEPSPGAMSALRDASRMDKYEIVKTSAGKSYSILSLNLAQSNHSIIPEQKKDIKKIQKQLFIGLTDLDAINVAPNISLALSNRLGSELYQTGYFVVLERQKMQEILKEQGFQLSGCTSNECVIEMGKLLNVKQMLAGSISKVGSLYSLNLRLIDVQTGKIVSTAIEDINGNIELVLTHGIKNSVIKLINNFNE